MTRRFIQEAYSEAYIKELEAYDSRIADALKLEKEDAFYAEEYGISFEVECDEDERQEMTVSDLHSYRD